MLVKTNATELTDRLGVSVGENEGNIVGDPVGCC